MSTNGIGDIVIMVALLTGAGMFWGLSWIVKRVRK